MTKITTISINKSKIALYKLNGVRSVMLNVMIRAGSYYEKGENWGAFHFLEHLVFNGTEKLPTLQDIENFKYEHGIVLHRHELTEDKERAELMGIKRIFGSKFYCLQEIMLMNDEIIDIVKLM